MPFLTGCYLFPVGYLSFRSSVVNEFHFPLWHPFWFLLLSYSLSLLVIPQLRLFLFARPNRRSVCELAREFLDRSYAVPCIQLSAVAPTIFEKVCSRVSLSLLCSVCWLIGLLMCLFVCLSALFVVVAAAIFTLWGAPRILFLSLWMGSEESGIVFHESGALWLLVCLIPVYCIATSSSDSFFVHFILNVSIPLCFYRAQWCGKCTIFEHRLVPFHVFLLLMGCLHGW